MPRAPLWNRTLNYYKRNSARLVFKRSMRIRNTRPLISFTFDDFPRTALLSGGEILRRHGVTGSYYVSLSLLGKDSPSGEICNAADLLAVLRQGHELGCHTFLHSHSWNTATDQFEASIRKNQEAIEELIPGMRFRSLSYPIGEPRPLTKRAAAKHFRCCRAGGQTLNTDHADLNQLSAFFLEQSAGRMEPIRELINRNKQVGGWLIFATHDVCPAPSRYGCTPEFFEHVVQCAVDSGASILPVTEALDVIQGDGRKDRRDAVR